MLCSLLLLNHLISFLQGDSGGPLVTEVNGRWTAIGLSSWTYSCGKAAAPSIFTKLSEFMFMLDEDTGMFCFICLVIFLSFSTISTVAHRLAHVNQKIEKSHTLYKNVNVILLLCLARLKLIELERDGPLLQ